MLGLLYRYSISLRDAVAVTHFPGQGGKGKMLVKTSAFAKDEANALIVHGSSTMPLWASNLKLYKDGPTPSPGSLLSDFTEANYSGYAAVAMTWNPPHLELDGSYSLISSLSNFLATDSTTTNNIKGALIVYGSDSTKLAMAEEFPTVIPISQAGDGFGYVASVNAGNASDNSEGSIIQ